MNLSQVIGSGRLNNSFIFGYYGGGNFGDELLLEVLLDMLEQAKVRDVSFMYSDPERYQLMHRPRSYQPVFGLGRVAGQLLRRRNIIVGGGGHWGLDMNPRIFIMTIGFFLLHLILRKKIYLLGVGYYRSTSRMGHMSAWLAARSSECIMARDDESYENFRRFNRGVVLSQDIVFNLDQLDLAPYEPQARQLADALPIKGPTVLLSLRRFQAKYANDYDQHIVRLIERNPRQHFIIMILEPQAVDPHGFRYIQELARQHINVVAADFAANPLALVAYLRRYRQHLRMIAPQYHMQLIAHLLDIPHFPVAYDNKVRQLLASFGVEGVVGIGELKVEQLQEFIV